MEIGALLRDVLRRTWVVAVLVVLAAGGAWLATSGSKDLYRASVDLTIPDSSSSTVGETGQYVANFVQAIDASSVTAAVAKQTGVSVDDVVDGGSADQLGNSKYITIVYQSDDRDVVGKVATALAQTGAAMVAESGVKEAEARVAAAQADLKADQAALDKAKADYNSLLARYQNVSPVTTFNYTQSLLAQTQGLLLRAQGDGQPTGALSSQISQLRATLASLSGPVQQFNDLQSKRDQANQVVSTSIGKLKDANANLAIAKSMPLIEPPVIEVTSGTVARVRAAMISAGIAAIVGFALLVLLAGLTAGRGRRRQAGEFGGAAAPAPADSLLGGFMAPVNGVHAGPVSPYTPPVAAPPTGEIGSRDDLLAFPPTSPTQPVRRRDAR